MDRRLFLKGLLGLGASVALPKPALAFIERSAEISDAAFQSAALADDAIINLLEARMRAATAAMIEAIESDIFNVPLA